MHVVSGISSVLRGVASTEDAISILMATYGCVFWNTHNVSTGGFIHHSN